MNNIPDCCDVQKGAWTRDQARKKAEAAAAAQPQPKPERYRKDGFDMFLERMEDNKPSDLPLIVQIILWLVAMAIFMGAFA